VFLFVSFVFQSYGSCINNVKFVTHYRRTSIFDRDVFLREVLESWKSLFGRIIRYNGQMRFLPTRKALLTTLLC